MGWMELVGVGEAMPRSARQGALMGPGGARAAPSNRGVFALPDQADRFRGQKETLLPLSPQQSGRSGRYRPLRQPKPIAGSGEPHAELAHRNGKYPRSWASKLAPSWHPFPSQLSALLAKFWLCNWLCGYAPGWIRTSDPRLRRPQAYPDIWLVQAVSVGGVPGGAPVTLTSCKSPAALTACSPTLICSSR
jgi:hypothetical protein